MDKSLVEEIEALKSPICIGISGFGGAGKTTFSTELAAVLECPVVGVDSFIKDRTLTEYTNWNLMDFKRLEVEVLQPFIQGEKEIVYGHFDWGANKVTETVVLPKLERLIVEGVGLFRPELLNYFAYCIWIDCPLEVALARGKRRDREVYNYPQDELWDGLWKENDQTYFETCKPKETAHRIIQCPGFI